MLTGDVLILPHTPPPAAAAAAAAAAAESSSPVTAAPTEIELSGPAVTALPPCAGVVLSGQQ